MLLGAIEVAGATACPAAPQVEARLAELPPTRLMLRAELSDDSDDGALRLTLRREGNELVGQRTVRLTTDCAARAGTVAVMLSAWAGELDGPRLVPHLVQPLATPVAAPTPWRFHVGVGVVGDLSGSRATWGGALEVSAGPAAAWVRALVMMSTTDVYRVPLGGGTVAWQRAVLGLGPRLSHELGRFELGIDAQVLGALVAAAASGFARNESTLGADIGGGAGVRMVFRPFAELGVWVRLGGQVWPSRQRLAVDGVAAVAILPLTTWELALGLVATQST